MCGSYLLPRAFKGLFHCIVSIYMHIDDLWCGHFTAIIILPVSSRFQPTSIAFRRRSNHALCLDDEACDPPCPTLSPSLRECSHRMKIPTKKELMFVCDSACNKTICICEKGVSSYLKSFFLIFSASGKTPQTRTYEKRAYRLNF